MARDVPGRPGFLFGLEDEPFTSGYAALAAATTDADGTAPTARSPCRRPARSAVRSPSPPPLRVRDGSGRPVERSLTRPLLPRRAAHRPAPALRRRGRRGRHRRLRGDRPRPRPRADRPRRPSSWTLSRVETDFQWYEADGVWNYEPITRRSRVANGTARPRRRRARPARPARRLGPLRARPRRHRRPLHRDERRLRRRLGRRRRRLRDARLPRASASTARPTPPATPPAPASSSRTPASSSSPSWATG